MNFNYLTYFIDATQGMYFPWQRPTVCLQVLMRIISQMHKLAYFEILRLVLYHMLNLM